MIPCRTEAITIQRPVKVDRVTIVITEVVLKDLIAIYCEGQDIGPQCLKLPEEFHLNHYVENGNADIEVVFNVEPK